MNSLSTALGPVSFATIALGFAAGAAIGASYFLGLWWTVRRATRSTRPTPLLLVSFVVRLAFAVALLLVIVRLGALALAAALLGFLVARVLLTRALAGRADVAGGTDVATGQGPTDGGAPERGTPERGSAA
ncbi:MAG: ATP synthase subunit I [Trueperaceae bacterium]